MLLLRIAAAFALIVLSACFSVALEVGFALVADYPASSQSTDRPALAGLRTVPAPR
jgi:hypothetical protein